MRRRGAGSTLLMLTAVCATLAHARRGEALSCAPPMERFELTLVSVTLNGAPVTDLGPWQRHQVSVIGQGEGGFSFNAYRADRADESTAYGFLERRP
ncbi:MAG: hypothetical protein Q8S73_16225 [Deltaproteobacteria bacterium]|nr:hypothetical protein [Myxococcales bacterium]MDP3215655.1 hypothetical protein [Deltaproteobacteria bacterium]